MIHVRRTVCLAVATITAAALLPLSGASAAAARACSGLPTATDGVTVSSATYGRMLVELRHSPSIDCLWGRLSGGRVGDGVTVFLDNDPWMSATITQGTSVFTEWSSRGYPGRWFSACAVNDSAQTVYMCSRPKYPG
ncbi:hypothetical protein STRCI_000394 [Streptomyces cinnabarinus]|uniref:Uncharacterized protein n=1 Tax=Streptomyces cinnabarinus TaxID=67287 RepID=A0ABY7K4C9_9ACTN|nr:hypothetical protein [Streptomyces cinnabarinus]WAZ19348.1 hypothetical protein STRCI_000394 [Streptomyces cinnabarinus]